MVSFPHHVSLLKQIHHEGEGGVCPRLPDQVFTQRGVTTEESKATLPMSILWLHIPAAAEFH